MTKDIKKYVEQAKTLSDSSTQNRDINKLAALMMIEDMLEEIHAELQKINAQPEHKKGKWILPNNQIAVFLNEWICSECHYLIAGKHNYCPNCGAEMKGEDDANNSQI